MFPSDTDFESEFTFETSAVPLPDEPPFHILILGDWSGNADRKALGERQPIEIDRDNFDQVLNRLTVSLDLNLSGDQDSFLSLQFSELDDFHPDNIFRNVSLFSDLRDVRRRLAEPDSFERAAGEVRAWFNAQHREPVEADYDVLQLDDAPPIDSDNLLDSILSQTGGSSAAGNAQIVDNSELGKFVSKIVSPHLIKIDETEQSKLIAAVDETISRLMRMILHHPKFQALESSWRGLYFLVRRLETSSVQKLFILDVLQSELADNLKSSADLTDSYIYRQLNAESFAFIAGNYSFSANVDDIALLMRLGKLGAAFTAPFFSYLKPEFFDHKDLSENDIFSNLKITADSGEFKLWNALRSAPESSYIGLSPMRIFGRLPYGEAADSTEAFNFEEFEAEVKRSDLLWINPCFAVSLLLALSYGRYGWNLQMNLLREIEKMPMYFYRENGESKTVPCAEFVLTDAMLEEILKQGLTALVSFRDQTKIRLARLQSVSATNNELKGRWNA